MARSLQKAPFVSPALIRKTLKKGRPIQTWARDCFILPEFIGADAAKSAKAAAAAEAKAAAAAVKNGNIGGNGANLTTKPASSDGVNSIVAAFAMTKCPKHESSSIMIVSD